MGGISHWAAGYPRHQHDYMQVFLFSEINFLKIAFTITKMKCNSFWATPSDYNYISEFEEEFILQNLHLQWHF